MTHTTEDGDRKYLNARLEDVRALELELLSGRFLEEEPPLPAFDLEDA
jgi:hypothetical protein